jgi:hypothetical protein
MNGVEALGREGALTQAAVGSLAIVGSDAMAFITRATKPAAPYLPPQRCRLNDEEIVVPPGIRFIFRRAAQIHQWATTIANSRVPLHHIAAATHSLPADTSTDYRLFRRDAQIHQWATTIANPRVPLHHVAAAMHSLSADKSTDYRAVFMIVGAPLIVVTFGKRTTTQARGGGAAKSRRKN